MGMAEIGILTNPEAFESLRIDLAHATDAYVLAFKVQAPFFAELFAGFLDTQPMHLLANHSEETTLRHLMREFPRLHGYVWSKNRLFHSKVICLPSVGVAHVGSHNLTRYAYTAAINHTVRIADPETVEGIQEQIEQLITRARGLNAYSIEELII